MTEMQRLGRPEHGTQEAVLRFGHDDDGVVTHSTLRGWAERSLDLLDGESSPVRHGTDAAHRRTETLGKFGTHMDVGTESGKLDQADSGERAAIIDGVTGDSQGFEARAGVCPQRVACRCTA